MTEDGSVGFRTSLILIPPLAMNFSTERFLGLDVQKIIWSKVSLPMVFQLSNTRLVGGTAQARIQQAHTAADEVFALW